MKGLIFFLRCYEKIFVQLCVFTSTGSVHRFVYLCVTAIPQKTQRKPQKTQSVV